MYNIKKNIDKLKRGEPTFFLEPNEIKEVSKYFKKDEFNIFKPFEEAEKVILYRDKLPKVIFLTTFLSKKIQAKPIIAKLQIKTVKGRSTCQTASTKMAIPVVPPAAISIGA